MFAHDMLQTKVVHDNEAALNCRSVHMYTGFHYIFLLLALDFSPPLVVSNRQLSTMQDRIFFQGAPCAFLYVLRGQGRVAGVSSVYAFFPFAIPEGDAQHSYCTSASVSGFLNVPVLAL